MNTRSRTLLSILLIPSHLCGLCPTVADIEDTGHPWILLLSPCQIFHSLGKVYHLHTIFSYLSDSKKTAPLAPGGLSLILLSFHCQSLLVLSILGCALSCGLDVVPIYKKTTVYDLIGNIAALVKLPALTHLTRQIHCKAQLFCRYAPS